MTLSVPKGYTLTIGQFLGDRPVMTVECRACHWREVFDLTLDADTAVTGREVWAAVGMYTVHPCAHVESDMQDVPAGVPC